MAILKNCTFLLILIASHVGAEEVVELNFPCTGVNAVEFTEELKIDNIISGINEVVIPKEFMPKSLDSLEKIKKSDGYQVFPSKFLMAEYSDALNFVSDENTIDVMLRYDGKAFSYRKVLYGDSGVKVCTPSESVNYVYEGMPAIRSIAKSDSGDGLCIFNFGVTNVEKLYGESVTRYLDCNDPDYKSKFEIFSSDSESILKLLAK